MRLTLTSGMCCVAVVWHVACGVLLRSVKCKTSAADTRALRGLNEDNNSEVESGLILFVFYPSFRSRSPALLPTRTHSLSNKSLQRCRNWELNTQS